MVKKRSTSDYIFDTVLVIFFILLMIIMLYPLLYTLFVSFSNPAKLVRFRGILYKPLGFSLEAYKIVLNNSKILQGFRNTIFILVVGLFFNLILTSIGAYFLSRRNSLLFKPFMIMILISMYFSGGLIPLYLTVRSIGLYNSLWSQILPVAVSTYNMILLRSYFATIPESIVESVEMDGGNHFVIIFKMFIPLSLPAMAVMVLRYGVNHWNSWFKAMIFLRSAEKYPLQLILREMLILGTSLDLESEGIDYEQIEESVKAATVIVSTVPILLIYPFLQKYFVSGMLIGSLKE